MNELLRKIFETLKSFIPADKQAEAETAMSAVKIEEPKTDIKNIPPDLKAVIQPLLDELNALKQINTDLMKAMGEEKKTRDAGITAEQDRQKAAQKLKVDTAVDKAIKTDKKYPESERQNLTALFEGNFEAAEKIVGAAQTNKVFVPGEKKDNTTTTTPANTPAATPLERVSNTGLRDKIRASAGQPAA